MKKLKIELDLLIIILMEAVFLLFFFKNSIIDIFLGSIIGFIAIFLTRKIPTNKFLEIILCITSIIVFPIILDKTIHFISNNILRNYPYFILLITFLFCIFLVSKRGFHTFIKALEISCYFFIIIKIIALILIIPNINFNNFNMQLISEIHININFLYLPLAILYFYLSIKYLTNSSFHKYSYTISILNPLFVKLITILAMGHTLFYLYEYPYVNLFKRIKYFDFIERMEGILSFEYLFAYFFLNSFIILIIITIFKKKLKKKEPKQ